MEKTSHGEALDQTNTSLNANKTDNKLKDESCNVGCSLIDKQLDCKALSAKREFAISRIQARDGDIQTLTRNCNDKVYIDKLLIKFVDFENQYEIDESAFVFKTSRSPVQSHSGTKLTRWRHYFNKQLQFKHRFHSITVHIKQSTGTQHRFRLLYKAPIRLLNIKKLSNSELDKINPKAALDRFWMIVERGATPIGVNDSAVDICEHSNKIKKHDLPQNGAFVCDFCENSAIYFCENCSYYYCASSFTSLHPAVGPFRGHSVIPASFSYKKQPCAIHGQPAKVFCQICMRRRCVECVNTICRVHFVINIDIDKEKTKLVEDMEKLNKAMGSLNVYKDKVDDEAMKTEMLALYKKEKVRQEFISFHEMLIDSEALVCKRIDQEISRRLSSGWMGQETVFTGLQNDDTNLTSLTVDLLQTDSQDTFIKGTAGIHDRYADVHTRISDFRKTWAKNSINMDREINDILSQPFSLFREKKTFHESIQHITEGGPNISFRQKTLFFNDLTTPMMVEKFVTEPTLGPSTTIRYKLKVLRGPRYLLWETKTDSLKGLELNTMDTFKFEAGQRYLLKLHPTVLCHMSDQRKQETEHPPSHMLIIITSGPVWITPGPATDSKIDSDEDEYEEDD